MTDDGVPGSLGDRLIREDAPENLRYVVLQTAVDLGWAPSSLRTILCGVLRVPPDSGCRTVLKSVLAHFRCRLDEFAMLGL